MQMFENCDQGLPEGGNPVLQQGTESQRKIIVPGQLFANVGKMEAFKQQYEFLCAILVVCVLATFFRDGCDCSEAGCNLRSKNAQLVINGICNIADCLADLHLIAFDVAVTTGQAMRLHSHQSGRPGG